MSARLFVAVEVDDADRSALAAWAREVVGDDPSLRLVDAGQIHLTLAFLGHRALDEIPPLQELVADFAATPVPAPLRTAGALWLSPRRPHVLTVAVEDVAGALGALHQRVWGALEERLGVVRERRAFRPHLTVARVRRGWTPPSRRLLPPPAMPLRTGGLVLFRSWLGGGPARYEALTRASFSALS